MKGNGRGNPNFCAHKNPFVLKKSKGDGNSNEYINSYRKNSYSRKIA